MLLTKLIKNTHLSSSPSLVSLAPRRDIFFFRRLLNKQIKPRSDIVEKQYDQRQYISAMKKFQKESKGMLPDSPEWNEVRNRIYSELRQKKYQAQHQQTLARGQTVADDSQILDVSSYYNLLIVNHAGYESYEALNIINYFGFPINVEEEDWWRTSRKQFDFGVDDEYPYLVINSSHEDMPECEIAGREQLLVFLFNSGLIGAYRTYGAYE